MKLLLIALSSLALANGLTLYAAYPFGYTAHGSALITPTQQQYATQDVLGQYAYGYAEPHSSKQEVRSLDGTTHGTYSYRDAEGKLQTVDYTADAAGFHVAATNLPRAVKPQNFRESNFDGRSVSTDTIEIAAARQSHLAAHDAARLRLAQNQQEQQQREHINDQSDLELPQPVADTAEVAAAKSIHLKRVANEKLRNELLGGGAAAVPAVPVTRSSHVIVPVPSVYSYSIPHYYSTGFYY